MQNLRYTTKCVDCGTKLENIDRPQPQTCRCGKITARNGSVVENKSDAPKQGQASMFPDRGDYPD